MESIVEKGVCNQAARVIRLSIRISFQGIAFAAVDGTVASKRPLQLILVVG